MASAHTGAQIVTLQVYTLWQMCALHEIAGRRFNRYHELGQFAFGEFSN